MYRIQFCSLEKLKLKNGKLRTPKDSDWVYLTSEDPFDDLYYYYDDANKKRIELYKRGDGYYRIVEDSGIMLMNILDQTMADGPGLRTSIYCSGCYHKCPKCHNPQTHDINNGVYTPVSQILEKIINSPCSGVTFTGGDPLYQTMGFEELARRIQMYTDKNIWCYTGFTYEQILKSPFSHILKYIDVLVDGPYIDELRSEKLAFRGSSNQRIIDVKTGENISHLFDSKLS